MQQEIKYYVLLADMRTGSNLFEDMITRYDAFSCFGELFNPHFIGGPKTPSMTSLTLSERDADSVGVVSRMIEENPDTLPGFRLFSDHNPMMLEHCLADETCAKIVLTRNPLESYVSHLIAARTGQWQLQELSKRKDAKVTFNIDKFQLYLEAKQDFATLIRSRLQQTGQTSFNIDYTDMAKVETFNGCAKFLGTDQKLEAFLPNTKRQNPASMREKVYNYDEMLEGLRTLDIFESNWSAYNEPSQTTSSTVLHACRTAPILYFPLTYDDNDPTIKWMCSIERDKKPARTKMGVADVREWMAGTTNRTVITCLEHPVERIYRAFNDRIVFAPNDKNKWIRRILRERYELEIPSWGDGSWATKDEMKSVGYTVDKHKQNFIRFLDFIQGNLRGQTNAPVSPEWGSQYLAIENYHEWTAPTVVVMPQMRKQAFSAIEATYGLKSDFDIDEQKSTDLILLEQIYCPRIEQAVRIAYQNDYRKFGFQGWKPNS
jgi:LPS sulfotransferase NodH